MKFVSLNPWHGCHKCSEGCKFCYIHKGDAKRGVNTDEIRKFQTPVRFVQKYVETLSAKLILSGNVHQGDTILIDRSQDGLEAVIKPEVEVVE